MSIRIHHLNCGTMCPLCDRLINNKGGSWQAPGHFVCHCLLIEAPEGLILVDTGLGTQDVLEPKRRLGLAYPKLFKPQLNLKETAVSQIKALGFKPEDVRHIVITHVDLDHAGGLADFPNAQVHVFKPELDQLLQPSFKDRNRFRLVQFDHQPKWVVHQHEGDNWFGFNSIRALPGVSTDVLLIPLVGHTRGHTGVAVKQKDTWLLHCGDAYYHHTQISAHPQVPIGSMFFQKTVASKPSARAENLQRLVELAAQHSDQVKLFCSHSPVEFNQFTAVH